MLISDSSSVVRAAVANLATIGLLEHGSASDSLALTNVGKDKRVEEGDIVFTAGSPGGRGDLPSLFPRGILIGTVTYVNQTDTDIYKHIQVQPFVNLSSLRSVLVLVPKKPRAPRP
jgi:cell shape-determining protein MreC